MILSTDPYDPLEDEDRRPGGHISRKEVRILLIAVVVLAIVLTPLYQHLMSLRNNHVCEGNLKAIATAIDLYASDNNDRFPPIYQDTDTDYAPQMFKNGPLTWISLCAPLMEARASFLCPSAEETENVTNESSQSNAGIISSYGMFGALSAFPRASISSLGQTGLIADSSNDGANATADPIPFLDAKGRKLPDGFLIGFDNTNFTPAEKSLAIYSKSKYPTRLAFPESSDGDFRKVGRSRHDLGVHIIMGDLHLKSFPRETAGLRRLGKNNDGEIVGLWAIP